MSRRALKSISAGISGVVLCGALTLAAPTPPSPPTTGGDADGASSGSDAPVVISMPDGRRIVYRINTKVRTGPRTSRFSVPWPGIKRMSSGRSGSGGVTFGPHGSSGSATAGSRTSHASSGGGGDSSGGGPDMGQAWVPEVPRSDGGSGAVPPKARITFLTGPGVVSGMAPYTVHVQATDSDLGSGMWQEAEFEWSFGDTSDEPLTTIDPRTGEVVQLNKEQQGFNAAYIYQKPGDYIITLRMKNAAGAWDEVKQKVYVGPSHRVVRYVDSVSGSNSNNGTSPSSAWRTFDYAISNATDNMTVYFRRGQVFGVSSKSELVASNTRLDAYGNGDKPIVRWIGPNPSDHSYILSINYKSEDVAVHNLRFETSLDPMDVSVGGIAVGRTSQTVWDCEFDGLWRWVSATSGVHGLFVLNCDGGTSRKHFFPIRGQDIVLIGISTGLRPAGIALRAGLGGVTRINTSWCIFNKDHLALPSGQMSLRYGTVQFGYLFRSALLHGTTDIGHHLGDTDYIVYDGCVFTSGHTGAGVTIKPNANNIMLRNNVFDMSIQGHKTIEAKVTVPLDGQYGVENLSIINNTFRLGKDTAGVYLVNAEFKITGLRFCNNLFVSHGDRATKTAPLLFVDSLESCVEIKNNVFPDLGDSYPAYVKVGDELMSWDDWLSVPIMDGDVREDVQLDDIVWPFFKPDPSSYPLTATNGRPHRGVFEDYLGTERDLGKQSTWAVGALSSASEGE